MNEPTSPLAYSLTVSLFRSLSLALSLGLRSRRSRSKNRPFESRPSRRTEPATAFPFLADPRSTLVWCRRGGGSSLARVLAPACVLHACVSLSSRALAVGAPHTHTHTKKEIYIYISLLLSLRVAHCRSRFVKPAPKVPPYRSHSLASRPSLSFFLSFSFPPFLWSRRRLAVRAS